jgi:hypothetical protein
MEQRFLSSFHFSPDAPSASYTSLVVIAHEKRGRLAGILWGKNVGTPLLKLPYYVEKQNVIFFAVLYLKRSRRRESTLFAKR